MPGYVSPQEQAENLARYKRFALWTAAALPLIMALMAIGYSDQMPLTVRRTVEQIDAVFGYPVLRLIVLMAG